MRHYQDIDAPGLPGEPTRDRVFRRGQYDHIDEKTLWHLWADQIAKRYPRQGYLILGRQHQ
jgi:hypothetical protein